MTPLSTKTLARKPALAMGALAAIALGLITGGPVRSADLRKAPVSGATVIDLFTELADDVTAQMLASDVYKTRAPGRKVRIVLGDVTNNSENEGVRVEDIYNEIRDQVVQSQTARIFAPGELNADLVISPELTSITVVQDKGRRSRCYTLHLTLSTVSGEYVSAFNAKRCTP